MEASNLGHFISIYEKFAQAENKSERTVEAVTAAARKFDRFLGGNTNAQDITADDLRKYILYLQECCKWSDHPTIKKNHDGLSSNTIAHHVRHIKSFWSWMYGEKFLEHNPLAQVRTPQETLKLVTPLTSGDVTQLIKVIPRDNNKDYRNACVTITLYGTILRISELLGLPLANVDFTNGQIKVLGKGAKERSVFMSPKVYKPLFKYYSKWRPKVTSDYFFIHEDGRKLTRFYFEHRMQAYVRKANLTKPCTPHLLRYSGAIQLLRNGCDPYTLQQILGHSTMEMTRRYLKIANSDIEKSLKTFSPAEQVDIRF
ncbi:MAG TPA: tyrosine-type recombinase/integrase [Dehalococcoidia bacterium]|nr:tyrosine-type recombinase/integrase [Dehalococcoidia bacterium]